MAHGRAALIASFQTHYEELLRFLGRRVGTGELARELAQDTYLRLATMAAAPEVADARAYIFRAAANLAIDHARRDGRRIARSIPGEAADEIADPSPSADRAIMARERLVMIEAALDELAPNFRSALLLNRIDGLSHAEIALSLGVSESMVAKYIAKALRHCRARLDREAMEI